MSIGCGVVHGQELRQEALRGHGLTAMRGLPQGVAPGHRGQGVGQEVNHVVRLVHGAMAGQYLYQERLMKFDLELMKVTVKGMQWDVLKSYAKDGLGQTLKPEQKKRLDWLVNIMGKMEDSTKSAMGVIADKDRRFRKWFVQ